MSTAFQAISVVGGVVPPSLLGRIQSGDVNDPKSLDPASYHLMGTETVRDASSRSWGYLRTAWQSWRELDAKKRPDGQGAGTGDARQKWLLILLREFGYGQVPATGGGLQAADTTYPISHRWESVPIHLLGPGVELDKRSPGVEGAAKRAPQAMVQEFLNRESDYLWAILSNGLKLRLLRDSTALAGSAYIEFDLETIFDSDLYPEFQILWQLCHQSRLDKRGGAEGSPADCWLESWRAESVDAGARALDKLGVGVEKALDYLGTGFLRHPENGWLVDALHTGELGPRDFHKALLRAAYRLLFCFVVEDRNALLVPDAPAVSRERYAKYFSTQRLRRLSRSRDGGPHPDLWRTQKLVLSALGGDGLEAVGLPALGGLFDPDSRATKLAHQPHEDLLLGAELANQDFLKAIRRLSWVLGKGDRLQPVDYRHLGAEELGSVYESLLELIPRIDTETRSFELVRLAGNERKVTGSYYTPPSLVSALLDTALDPLLDDAVNGGRDAADRESRLLALTVCDPASGSGGFLVAAARRIARRLAEVRAGENEPTPAEIQHALHDVVERCIYGVDMNDLAAELAKVSLWLEAMEPGKPLGFLDARIKIGNSLLGTTPALLAGGVPDEAFGVLEGDDKRYAAEVKKRNRAENATSKAGGRFVHGGQEAFTLGRSTSAVAELIGQRQKMVKPVSTAAEARSRAKAYEAFDHSADMEQKRLHADAWCAAFVWPLNAGEAEPPTSSVVRQLGDGGDTAVNGSTVARVRQLADEYRFFHWHVEFPEVFGDPEAGELGSEGWPGGFSCLLGNPPWEKIKVEEKSYFAARSPLISEAANASVRKKMIQGLAESDPIVWGEFRRDSRKAAADSKFMGRSGRYPLGGVGDVNTYAVFSDLALQLISPHGRAGLVVQAGIVNGFTYREYVQKLIEESRLVSFLGFENEERIFADVHNMTKFGLLTVCGRRSVVKQSEFMSHARKLEDLVDARKRYTLTADEIRALNPNTLTLPTFRWGRDADVSIKLALNSESLVADHPYKNPWNVEFSRMFDMANDSGSFEFDENIRPQIVSYDGSAATLESGRRVMPLVEGKMLWHFDYRYGTYEDQTKAQSNKGVLPHVSDIAHDDRGYRVWPRYWIDCAKVDATRWWDDRGYGFAWRDVGPSERTYVGCVVPPSAAGDKAPLLRSSYRGARFAAFVGLMSSLVVDYAARQRGTNMKYFLVKQLPTLSPLVLDETVDWVGRSSSKWIAERVHELTYTSDELRGWANDQGDFDQPFRWNPSRRMRIQAELDAYILHLFGFSAAEAEWLIDSFTVLRKYEMKNYSEFRTKRLVMEEFELMGRCRGTGETYASQLVPPPGQGPRHTRKEGFA